MSVEYNCMVCGAPTSEPKMCLDCQRAGSSFAAPTGLAGVVCCCGAPATGRMSDGSPRCCATCAFHPAGCRCKYGDKPDTADEPQSPANEKGQR